MAIGNALEVFYAVILLQLIANTVCNNTEQFEGFLLCRQCGFEVADSKQLINVPSQLAHRRRNESFPGSQHVLIQLFQNPNGKYFELISATSADIQKVQEPHTEYSWFPGFSWTVAVCPRCGHHLGWVFDPLNKASKSSSDPENAAKHDQTFFGLILEHLLHEHEANFIVAPKAFVS